MKLLFSRRRIAAALFIVLLLFLLRPGASRLKSKVVWSMSSALGHNVDIGSVHLRLLPWPGFDLNRLVVYDDPAFGAEPILRAGEVAASLRLTSLLRGRLEIGRLELSDASLNIVRGDNGRWNLESLLERTAHTPLAPTAKAKSEPRLAFPYIEATSARINFKSGTEKKAYALNNADFALWQDSENTWGVRLRAQPVRTDLNLNDTGIVHVEGKWQRAVVLRNTPVQFNLEWDHPQLGQLTKFFTGSDQGWRGGVQVTARIQGTPANLQFLSDASIQDFRRYDISSGQSLLLATHCEGMYSVPYHSFHGVVCRSPVSGGEITMHGDAALAARTYMLAVSAANVPARALVDLAQRAKRDLPLDLTADGMLRGTLSIERDVSGSTKIAGKGALEDFQLSSASSQAQIGRQTIPFLFADRRTSDATSRSPKRAIDLAFAIPDGAHIEFGPVMLGAHGSAAVARGWVNAAGYNVSLSGDAEVLNVLRLARIFGIPAMPVNADGIAQLDLQAAGSWRSASNGSFSSFAGPQITGTARLRSVRVAVRGTAGPIEILSGDVQLSQETAFLRKLNARAAGSSWNGSVEVPRGCGAPGNCEAHFSLHAGQASFSSLRQWAKPKAKERPWYDLLEATAPATPSSLENLRASGQFTVDHWLIRGVTANHVSADVTVNRGKIDVTELTAQVLGGTHRGAWHADFRMHPEVCKVNGTLTGVSLTQVADVMHDPWITGSADATYEATGSCGADFWQTVNGSLVFDVHDGTLTHVSLSQNEGPLRIVQLSGHAQWHDGKLEVKEALLETGTGRFQISGEASPEREVSLKLARLPGSSAPGYIITGTLAEPRVKPLPEGEQARLKTAAAP